MDQPTTAHTTAFQLQDRPYLPYPTTTKAHRTHNPPQHATQTQHPPCTPQRLHITLADHACTLNCNKVAATHNTTTCTTHPVLLTPQPSMSKTTSLCTQVTNTRHSWQINVTQIMHLPTLCPTPPPPVRGRWGMGADLMAELLKCPTLGICPKKQS